MKDFDTACNILHNMALEYEKPWWKRVFKRWHIHHEPLRHDAANFLRRIKYERMRPLNTRLTK